MNSKTTKSILGFLVLLLLTIALAILPGLDEQIAAGANDKDYLDVTLEAGSANCLSLLALDNSDAGELGCFTSNDDDRMLLGGIRQSAGPAVLATGGDTGTISGSVKSAESGKLIDRAAINVRSKDNSVYKFVYANAGRYEIEVPAMPGYEVRAYADGYETAIKENVVVKKNQNTVLNFLLQVRRIGRLTGMVYDAETGDPVANAYVQSDYGYVISDIYGCYSMWYMPYGDHEIVISKEGFYESSKIVTLNKATMVNNFPLHMEMSAGSTKNPRVITVASAFSDKNRSAFFLDGVSFVVKFTTTVDWQGSPPGYVLYSTPQKRVKVTAPPYTLSLDMGRDFGAGGQLTAVAISANGKRSDPFDANIRVMKDEFHPLIHSLVKSGSGYHYKSKGGVGLVSITESGETPKVPDSVPFFGGKITRFNTYLKTESKIKSDGKEEITILIDPTKPDSGLDLFGMKLKFDGFGGKAYCDYLAHSDCWSFRKGHLVAESSLKKSFGPYYMMLGPVPFYTRYDLGSKLKGEVDVLALLPKDGPPKLSGLLNPDFEVEGVGGVGVSKCLGAELFVAGKIKPKIQFPQKPLFAEIKFTLGGGVRYNYVFGWGELSKIECGAVYRSSGGWSVSSEPYILLAAPRESLIEPIPRDYLEHTSAWRPEEQPRLMENGPLKETLLQASVFPQSLPDFVNIGEQQLLVFVSDDSGRDDLNRTRLVYSTGTDFNFADPKPVVQLASTADYMPVLAPVSEGAIAAWQNLGSELPPGSSFTDVLPLSEIAVSHYDVSTDSWSGHQHLTNNDYLDHQPALASAGDKAVLVWVSNMANDMVGGVDSPNELYYSLYDGQQWSDPSCFASDLGAILSGSLAYNGNSAVYTFCSDADGDPATTDDQDLFAITYDGTCWSGVNRLTNDNIPDAIPCLNYIQDNELEMVWYRNGQLVSAAGLDVDNSKVIADLQFAANPVDLQFIVAPEREKTVIWTESTGGSQNIFIAVYDNVTGNWGSPIQVTQDVSLIHSLAAVYSPQGIITAVYNKIQLGEEEQELELDGEIITVSVPVPMRSDICAMTYRPGNDLAVEPGSFLVNPANPLPGDEIEISADIVNFGEFAQQDVRVAFYNGDPEQDGQLIDELLIEGILLPGGRATTTLNWELSDQEDAPTVFLVVDPLEQFSDRDRTNNTASFQVSLPDLLIEQLHVERISPTDRAVTVSVENAGGVTVGKAFVQIFADDPGENEPATTELVYLSPGEKQELGFLINGINALATELSITAKVEGADDLVEFNYDNNEASMTIHPYDENRVAAPVTHPAPGEILSGMAVTLGTSTVAAEIYYTTGGTDPAQFGLKYEDPVVIHEDTTFRAWAYRDDLEPSEIMSFSYKAIECVFGDVNGNGQVEVDDAIIVLRAISGLEQLTGSQLFAADVTGEMDGIVNVTDAILILRHIVGLVDRFPAETMLH